MNLLHKLLFPIMIFIMLVFPLFSSDAYVDESQAGKSQRIEVFDFKNTPMSDVLKVFTELTGKNVISSRDIMKLKVTLFLKNVTSDEALKTLCKLYNFWYSEEDNVIRVMTAQEYGKELTIRRDEKTIVYKLKYASSLAAADLLENLFGDRIQYKEPGEIESYGHVGTEEGMGGRSRDNYRGGGKRGYNTETKREYYLDDNNMQVEIGKQLTSKRIEQLEKSAADHQLELKDIFDARQSRAIVYLAVFPRNNYVICRSVDPRILEEINSFLEEIDTPTSQVLLECKILEITLDDNFKSFFDWKFKPGSSDIIVGNFTNLTAPNFIYSIIDKHIEARVELLGQDNRLKVIGTPIILSANNAPGEFFVGEKRPITVNYEQEIREFEDRTTETVRPVIEMKDIGTKITITPSINEDRTVTMRFLLEVDSVKNAGAAITIVTEKSGAVEVPIDVVDTSRVENIIVANDGSTLAIGGLIRETLQDNDHKVPLLGDIPLLGFFFRKTEKEKKQKELVFLITPHIMMTPREGQEVSNNCVAEISEHPFIKKKQGKLLRYDEGMDLLYSEGDPIEEKEVKLKSRRAVAQKHVKLAEEYVTGGMFDKAKEEYEEALEIDPGNSKAKKALSKIKKKMFKKTETKLDSDKINAYIMMADECVNRGLFSEAAKEYKKVLKLDPENKGARKRLAELDKNTLKIMSKRNE
ncbi:MAG: hypothetical protein KAS46_01465 [Candidatus Aureabacteria bacterium]|nr:hypothetical protein [Candidatus Auribacterota bacterium]